MIKSQSRRSVYTPRMSINKRVYGKTLPRRLWRLDRRKTSPGNRPGDVQNRTAFGIANRTRNILWYTCTYVCTKVSNIITRWRMCSSKTLFRVLPIIITVRTCVPEETAG